MAQREVTEYDQLDGWIGGTLIGGLLLSIAVMIIGLLTVAVRGETASTVLPLDRVLPELGKGSAAAVLDTGILLLFATPLGGVIVALVGFTMRRNLVFVAVTTALLILLLIGFAVALH